MDKLQVVSSLLARRELPYWAVAPAFIVGYATAKAVVDYREWYSLGEGQTHANIYYFFLFLHHMKVAYLVTSLAGLFLVPANSAE